VDRVAGVVDGGVPVNAIDYVVLVGVLAGIAAYGLWRTRRPRDFQTYVKGASNTHWLAIGLSVMATQASAVTFLSTPGQGYESGLGFVQNYFGAPLALLVISIVFLPIYRGLNVYTAYEYLGRRFDSKTRLLGAGLFLLQRGLGAGITIYAPAIVLSTVMGWRLDFTIVCSGLLVVAYTVTGGSPAVNLTQRFQIGVIFVGMVAAFFVLLAKLPGGLSFGDALAVAGGFHKLEAVDYSFSPDRRYTLWTGLLGGTFLALSYFGTDQSQVQRYLAGVSVRESRLGLMFNALFKIPMQFFILLLGVLVFVFYQFEHAPVFFNQSAWQHALNQGQGDKLRALESEFQSARASEQKSLQAWIEARHAHDPLAESTARQAAQTALARAEAARADAKAALHAADPKAPVNDSDYVFISFILAQLPHGLIGLLVTVFFAATFSSKAGELNALGSTTVVDFYRHVVRRDANDAHYVSASRWFTALWGFVAIGFALFANLVENLIQATNIIGSIFYGVVLGLFLTAFFLKHVRGTAVFWAAVGTELLIVTHYFFLRETWEISYLWYNVIGCSLCMLLACLIQAVTGRFDAPVTPA
jgi:solute:Na+ symporter, SSS family